MEVKRSSSAASKQSSASRGSKERTSSVKPKQTASESKTSKDTTQQTPTALVFDECKPGWTLSVVLDSSKAVSFTARCD